MDMSSSDKEKFYEKVGNAATEVFKKKYPNLCKIIINELSPNFIVLQIYTMKWDVDVQLYEIDKFINDYFSIKSHARLRVPVHKCE